MNKRLLSVVILLFISITTSGYAYSSVPGNYLHLLLVVPIAGLLFFSASKTTGRSILESGWSLYFYLFCLFSSLCSTLVNASVGNLSAMAKFWIVVTFAYLFSCVIPPRIAARYFVYFFTSIVVVSLIAYTVENSGLVSLPLPTFTNVNGMPYKGGIIFFLFDNFLVFRNIGPFWEPGIFATYLGLVFVVSMIVPLKGKLLIWFILVLGLISTLSSASIFILIMMPVFWLSVAGQNSRMRGLIVFMSGMIALVLFLNLSFFVSFLFELVPFQFAKFEARDSVSLDARFYSVGVNMDIFYDRPIFGYGLAEHQIQFSGRSPFSQTSTTTGFLASLGILGIGYALIWMVAIFRLRLNLTSKLVLVVFVFGVLNKEPHTFFTLTFISLFYLLNIGSVAHSNISTGGNLKNRKRQLSQG